MIRYPSSESDWKITKVTELKISTSCPLKPKRALQASDRLSDCFRSADCGEAGGQRDFTEGARGEEAGEAASVTIINNL